MANQGSSKDGWRTKGVKQLRIKEIVRACQLSDELEKQGIGHTITIFCNHDFEIQRARDAKQPVLWSILLFYFYSRPNNVERKLPTIQNI